MMIKPWKTIRTAAKSDFNIFSIRTDHKRSPRNGHEQDFVIIEAVNWVNVIAVTSSQELVLVEQVRHGTDTIELEIPGGVMDPEDQNPIETGIRELKEETGYEGAQARIIGDVFPNPAIMNNTCYTVLVEDCELCHELQLDHSEDIATKLIPIQEIAELVREGKIKHSLVVSALYYHQLYREGL